MDVKAILRPLSGVSAGGGRGGGCVCTACLRKFFLRDTARPPIGRILRQIGTRRRGGHANWAGPHGARWEMMNAKKEELLRFEPATAHSFVRVLLAKAPFEFY